MTVTIETLTESLSKFSRPKCAGAETNVTSLQGGQPPRHDAVEKEKNAVVSEPSSQGRIRETFPSGR